MCEIFYFVIYYLITENHIIEYNQEDFRLKQNVIIIFIFIKYNNNNIN